MSIYPAARIAVLSSLLVVISLACGDDNGGSTGPGATGGLEVTLTITGEALDANGCVFTVDGTGQTRILAGESTTYTGLSVGQHEVAISDVAGNCQVLGGATRSVSVAADQTATVIYAVTCAEAVGSIDVHMTTEGEDQDPDGYEVVIDGGAPSAIGINGTLLVGALAAGDHTLAIEGVALNCAVGGSNPRTLAVVAGQTTHAAITVTCSSTSGSIAVSASTSGEDLDEDGYEIVIDGGTPSAIGINGSMTAGGLAPGDYSVELQGEAFNCEVGGSNPRSVTVTAGQETGVTFDVTCRYHLYDRIAFQSLRTGAWRLHAVDPYDSGAGVRPLGLEGTHPAVSRNGLRIAYSFEDDIWIARSDGSGATRVTSTPENESYPAWSPDGNWLAFDRDGDIWTMREDGSSQVRIWVFGTQPTWSPDGSRIAFVDAGDVHIMNADGSNVNGLTGNPTANQRPAWSPLGNYVGFASARDGSLHIFVQDPAGGTAVNMTIALISQANDPTWAPLAEAGAFSSDDSGTYDIYYFVPGSGGVVRLTDHPSTDVHPSWGGGN